MPFFSQFPKIQYDIQETNQPSLIHDIFRHVDVTTVNTDDFTTYTLYSVQDGDRPDIISQRLYGTPNYYWTFFIINDFLQAGFNEFYKSYQNLMRGIEIEYDPYGVLIFTADTSSFDGIDLTYDALRIQRGGTNYQAQIEKWNSEMMQLVTYNPTNASGFYAESRDKNGNYTETPQFYLTFAEGSDAVSNQAWLDEFNELRRAKNQTEESIATLSTVTFTAFDIYDKMINAPYRYTAQDILNEDRVEPGDELLAYDALIADATKVAWGDRTVFQSYYDYEEQRNEANRQIRVVDPNYIEAFAQEYRRLINL